MCIRKRMHVNPAPHVAPDVTGKSVVKYVAKGKSKS
jgi:hypothetical protein